MQQRVLLIANAQSVWVKELIRCIHVPLGHQVSLLTFNFVSPELEDFYQKTGTELIKIGQRTGIRGKADKAVKLFAFAAEHYHAYDLIILHSPPHSIQASFLAKALRRMDCKTITVFWGSDIQAISQKDAKKMECILKQSSAINLSTEPMRKAFAALFPAYKAMPVYQANFGSPAFSFIDEAEHKYSRVACKEHFGLNPQKMCVAVGYNGKPSQQHIMAIRALSKLAVEDKRCLQMLIHMGYGGQRDYIRQVEAEAEKADIEYKLIPHMLDMDEIALLRRATDIMLHAQTNDALSGTVRECIYAEAILINPTWITYTEFDEMGVSYVKYTSFDEIPGCLRSVLTGKTVIEMEHNKRLMATRFSWEAVRPAWLDMFEAVALQDQNSSKR